MLDPNNEIFDSNESSDLSSIEYFPFTIALTTSGIWLLFIEDKNPNRPVFIPITGIPDPPTMVTTSIKFHHLRQKLQNQPHQYLLNWKTIQIY